MLIARNRTKIS